MTRLGRPLLSIAIGMAVAGLMLACASSVESPRDPKACRDERRELLYGPDKAVSKAQLKAVSTEELSITKSVGLLQLKTSSLEGRRDPTVCQDEGGELPCGADKAVFKAQLKAMSARDMSMTKSTCRDAKRGYQNLDYSENIASNIGENILHDDIFEQQGAQVRIKVAGLLQVTASVFGQDGEEKTLIVGSSAFNPGGLPPAGSADDETSKSSGACRVSLDGFEEGKAVVKALIDANEGYMLNLATIPRPHGKDWWQISAGELLVEWFPLHTSTCHNVEVAVTHWGGCYTSNVKQEWAEDPYLLLGAKLLRQLGFKTLKTTSTKVGPPETKAADEAAWSSLPSDYSITDLAKHEVFQEIFDMDFTHFVLVAYTRAVTWDANYYAKYGMKEKFKKNEIKEMRELTEYLLTKYNGTGKTFVLQNWEGDNVLISGYNYHEERGTGKTRQFVQQGFIDWLAARQAGVTEGRNLVPNSDVTVLHACEASKVYWTMPDVSASDNEYGHKEWVTSTVLPHVQLDLVSYSSYDAQQKFEFQQVLDHLNSSLMPTEYVQTTKYASYPTYIGEYGMGEIQFNEDYSRIKPRVRNVIESCLRRECPFVLFWELFDNEQLLLGNTCEGFTGKNEDMKGLWLYRIDGSRYDMIQDLLGSYRQSC